ncbi:M15 family metallopeptidase [Citricoccus sp.]|uniref:M15 family metallopeptidase n=1 Tax=Citricoccus sp. TaxID=1978372 RepID=UPI0028BEB5C4|nr:M15 family metallopeptidase [Citricoccus sp.]
MVNKLHPLEPADYAPQDLRVPDVPASKASMELRDEAATAAEELFAAAADDGVDLTLVSAYRSYGYQQGTYGGWVERYGQAEADRISARPGYSEHQTGLAMDVGAADGACTLEQCFGDTPEGAWVAEHAAEHGWIIRYPDGAEDVTGYSPEPWHLRYVGTEAAAGVVRSGGVLETAWGLAPAPGY